MSHRNVFVPRLGTSNTQQSPCSTTEQRHDVSAPAIVKTGCPPHTPHGPQLRAGIPWFPVKGGTTWVHLQHHCDTRAHNNAAVRHSLFSLWALMHFLQHRAKSHIPQVRTEPSLQLQELLKSQKQQQCKSWSTGLEMPAKERLSCSAPELAFPSTDLPRVSGDMDSNTES